MKTRDEILAEMRNEVFSTRTAFFNLLDGCAVRREGRVAWPDALGVITIEQWNACYEGAVTFRDASRRGERPPMPQGRFTKD